MIITIGDEQVVELSLWNVKLDIVENMNWSSVTIGILVAKIETEQNLRAPIINIYDIRKYINSAVKFKVEKLENIFISNLAPNLRSRN